MSRIEYNVPGWLIVWLTFLLLSDYPTKDVFYLWYIMSVYVFIQYIIALDQNLMYFIEFLELFLLTIGMENFQCLLHS
jgi:hypothetical protein